MNDLNLNVVFIGTPNFPKGNAMTKRWRYMVDYMNSQSIPSHVLVCGHRVSNENPVRGKYGIADYQDISHLFKEKKYLKFWNKGNLLQKKWFDSNRKNIIIFSTRLLLYHLPFYFYAKKLGYHIVFDQVETTLLKNGKLKFVSRINIWISDFISQFAFKRAASFVISTALYNYNKEHYPKMKLCLLQNSTPIYGDKLKKKLHNPLKIVYSGTFSEKDGVSFLIDGVIKAVQSGAKVELIMTGRGQEWDMKILDKLKQYDWAKYLGFVSDNELLSMLLNADVLCMTRINSEFANYGFPFKLSEYLATGNILLATNVGDVLQYVKDGESAYVIDPENSDMIADRIMKIINTPNESIQIGHNGLAVAEKKFKTEIVGEKFVEFLNKI